MSIVDGHYRHGLRRMVGRDPHEAGRTATPLELLYDLTFVAAFGVAGNELAHGIAVGHGGSATIGFCFAMLAIIWAWINFSWFASAFDTDDWMFRILTMVQMSGVIVLAIGLPAMFKSIDLGTAFDNRVMVVGYVIMRVALVLQWLRAASSDPRYRTAALTYAAFVGTAQLGWVVVAIAPLPFAWALAAAAALLILEMLGPVVAETKGAKHGGGATPWNAHHIAERYSLLTIIALGETVLGTLASASAISAAEGWTLDAVVVVGTGIALSFTMWWAYFLVPHAPVLAARRTKAFPWGYGHVAIYGGIAATGAGLHVVGYVYDHHYEVSATAATVSIAVPVLIYAVALYAINTWLVSGFIVNAPLQLGMLSLPLIAIGVSLLGVPLWACLLIVLLSPALIIVSFELGAWRRLDETLERAVGGRHDALE